MIYSIDSVDICECTGYSGLGKCSYKKNTIKHQIDTII